MSIDLSDTFYGDPLTGGATSNFGEDGKPYGITSVGQLTFGTFEGSYDYDVWKVYGVIKGNTYNFNFKTPSSVSEGNLNFKFTDIFPAFDGEPELWSKISFGSQNPGEYYFTFTGPDSGARPPGSIKKRKVNISPLACVSFFYQGR